MYAVEIRIAHMVVEVKHSLNTPDCDSKRHQLKTKMNQLYIEFVLVTYDSKYNHGWNKRIKNPLSSFRLSW